MTLVMHFCLLYVWKLRLLRYTSPVYCPHGTLNPVREAVLQDTVKEMNAVIKSALRKRVGD